MLGFYRERRQVEDLCALSAVDLSPRESEAQINPIALDSLAGVERAQLESGSVSTGIFAAAALRGDGIPTLIQKEVKSEIWRSSSPAGFCGTYRDHQRIKIIWSKI